MAEKCDVISPPKGWTVWMWLVGHEGDRPFAGQVVDSNNNGIITAIQQPDGGGMWQRIKHPLHHRSDPFVAQNRPSLTAGRRWVWDFQPGNVYEPTAADLKRAEPKDEPHNRMGSSGDEKAARFEKGMALAQEKLKEGQPVEKIIQTCRMWGLSREDVEKLAQEVELAS